MSQLLISQYLNDKFEAKNDKALLIADYLQVNVLWLVGLSEDMERRNLPTSDEQIYSSAGISFIKVPLYPPICCGNGGFVEGNIIEYIPVPSRRLSEYGDYFCQIAIGESMKGAGVNDGDLLVFEVTSAVNSGTIGCFCIDENESMCKKYKEQNGMIILQPMNDEFDPIFIDLLNECFKCIGVLKKSIKDFE